MSGADALRWTELGKTRQVGVEQPDPGRAGHAEHGRLRVEHRESAGPHVQTGRAGAPPDAVLLADEQRRRRRAVEHAHAETPAFPVERRLEGRAPHTKRRAAAVVVRVHQLRVLVAETCARELVRGVAHLAAERLEVEDAVVPFATLDVVRNRVVVAILVVQHGRRQFLGRDRRAGIGRAVLPVVAAAAGRSAPDGRAFLHEDDVRPLPGCRDRSPAARDASPEDENVAGDLVLDA